MNNEKPCKGRFQIIYEDELGRSRTQTSSTAFITDPLAMDTVVAFENFKFPIASYGLDKPTTSLKITSYVGATETATHTRELLLD